MDSGFVYFIKLSFTERRRMHGFAGFPFLCGIVQSVALRNYLRRSFQVIYLFSFLLRQSVQFPLSSQLGRLHSSTTVFFLFFFSPFLTPVGESPQNPPNSPNPNRVFLLQIEMCTSSYARSFPLRIPPSNDPSIYVFSPPLPEVACAHAHAIGMSPISQMRLRRRRRIRCFTRLQR